MSSQTSSRIRTSLISSLVGFSAAKLKTTCLSTSICACSSSGSFMSALAGAGCVVTPSIAQGAAGTFSSLLACFRFHAASVFLGGQPATSFFWRSGHEHT